MINSLLISIFIPVLIFLISSLPLYFSIKLLKGRTTLIKTIFVSLIIGIIVSAINLKFHFFGGFLSFFLTIWLYHEIFRLKWDKAFFVWILQFIIIAIFYFLLIIISITILGIKIFLF